MIIFLSRFANKQFSDSRILIERSKRLVTQGTLEIYERLRFRIDFGGFIRREDQEEEVPERQFQWISHFISILGSL